MMVDILFFCNKAGGNLASNQVFTQLSKKAMGEGNENLAALLQLLVYGMGIVMTATSTLWSKLVCFIFLFLFHFLLDF